MKRRSFLKSSLAASATGAAVSAGLLTPGTVFAGSHGGDADPYKAKSVEEALKILGITAEESDKVTVEAPDLAENAAVVPVEVKADMDGVEEIIVMVSKNPTVMVAKFKLGKGAVPAVKCRYKVGKTGDVIGYVKVGDKYYSGKKAVKVTKGGCGG